MNARKPTQNGNALPLVLGIILIAAVGYGGWMFITNNNTHTTIDQALQEATPTIEAPVTDATSEDQSATTELPSSAPSTETAPAATADTAAAASTFDITKALSVRSVGNINAPIKIIEFASLTCSHCAHFHNDIYPELKTKYVDTGKVYIEFREFPLNDPALKATMAARCLPEDKYDSFVSLLFKTQDHWATGIGYMDALRQNAKLAGMSDETFDACVGSNEFKLAIADKMQKAQDEWKIAATPTFIINDGAETISGAVPVTEFERVFRKVSGDAVGEAPKVE